SLRSRPSPPTALRLEGRGEGITLSPFQPVAETRREPRRRGLALDQVVERAEADPALDQLLLVPVGKDHDGNARRGEVRAQLLQDGQAVQLREPYVQKDDVGLLRPGSLQRAQAVAGDVDRVAVQLELETVHLGD